MGIGLLKKTTRVENMSFVLKIPRGTEVVMGRDNGAPTVIFKLPPPLGPIRALRMGDRWFIDVFNSVHLIKKWKAAPYPFSYFK
ncbi:MAG: hypothetical protein QXS76_00090 [Candidatus Bathyarchaeia archaeon]